MTGPVGFRLVLASASPRRAQLLREFGYTFDVIEPPLEEPARLSDGLSPIQLAEALSFFKARSVAESLADGWVLGADTIATLHGEVFGKPRDRDDARRILRSISGTSHEVVTGVSLVEAGSDRRFIRHDVTTVVMRTLSDRDLDDYLDTNEWVGKAGAYGIQDHGDAFVQRIEGSFTNVVGLPMELLATMVVEANTPV